VRRDASPLDDALRRGAWRSGGYFGAAAIMVGVAAAASLVPALRASRVDPIIALRSD
jgi:ABC-type antimicrobial peptide transport system permease subunit